jgi:hypothetical protein
MKHLCILKNKIQYFSDANPYSLWNVASEKLQIPNAKRHDIAEILLMFALNTNQSIKTNCKNWKLLYFVLYKFNAKSTLKSMMLYIFVIWHAKFFVRENVVNEHQRFNKKNYLAFHIFWFWAYKMKGYSSSPHDDPGPLAQDQ